MFAFVPAAQPYFAGIAPPSANAGMVILSGAGMPPPRPPPRPLPPPLPASCAPATPRPSVITTAAVTKIPAMRISYAFLLLSGVADFPDGGRGVIRYVERSVAAGDDADRSAPVSGPIGQQEAGEEIL